MFNFFLIIYLLKDMVKNFMEFMPSIDSKTPIALRNINQLDTDKISNNPTPNSTNKNPNTVAEQNHSETVTSKSNLNPLIATELANSRARRN